MSAGWHVHQLKTRVLHRELHDCRLLPGQPKGTRHERFHLQTEINCLLRVCKAIPPDISASVIRCKLGLCCTLDALLAPTPLAPAFVRFMLRTFYTSYAEAFDTFRKYLMHYWLQPHWCTDHDTVLVRCICYCMWLEECPQNCEQTGSQQQRPILHKSPVFLASPRLWLRQPCL